MVLANIARLVGSFLGVKNKSKTMTYSEMYLEAQISPGKLGELRVICDRIKQNKARYEAVAKDVGDIPWWFVAVIHQMEGGGSFSTHLHNGDPLTARTIQVPKGRPLAGCPPFTWEESAVDAMKLMRYDKVTGWDIETSLNRLEKYNGLGYKKRGVPSPYLWSYTQFYKSGKFVADGKYDPSAVSKQAGCVSIMKSLGVV